MSNSHETRSVPLPTSRLAALLLGLCAANVASADISGQTVVAGNAVFIQTANGWIIKPSNGAIIEYAMFGVNANETIRFVQTSARARVLNRVLGDFPTHIDGKLIANGIVYLVNPAGVFVGPGGTVNVGGIYAAAGSMSNAAFLEGSTTFTNVRGKVENAGMITGKSVAALVGSSVVNSGTIKTGAGGLTALVATTGSVRFMEAGVDPRLFVDIDMPSDPTNPPGPTVGVRNSGKVLAGSGGQVLLGAGDMYSVAIRNTATSSVRAQDGLVLMKGDVIRQEGVSSGSLLRVEAERLDLAEDLRFDRARLSTSVRLLDDVTVRGQFGGAAETLYIQGTLTSESGAFHGLTSLAQNSVFHGAVGGGSGNLGSLTTSGDAFFNKDVTVEGNIDIAGRTLFNNGNRDQMMRSVSGSITLAGGLTKLGTNLLVWGNGVTIGGDAFAVGDLTIRTTPGSVIDFNGGGDQRVLSYTKVTLEGDVVKSTAGALMLTARNIEATGSISTTSGDLWFVGETTFTGNGDQLAEANAGALRLFGNATKLTNGALTLRGDSILANGNLANLAGDIRFEGLTEFIGVGDQSVTALGAIDADDDIVKTTDGDFVLAAGELRFGGDVRADGGSLTLDGDVLFDGLGNQAAVSSIGELVVTGDVTKTTAGDLLLSSDGDLSLSGDIAVASGSLAIDADSIGLDGANDQIISAGTTVALGAAVTKSQGDLQIAAGERIEIGGDVRVENGDLLFSGPVLIQTDAIVEGGEVRFDGTIDGTFALVVQAEGRITLGGNIGQNAVGALGADGGLRSLELNAGGLIEFLGSSVRVVELLALNGDAPESGTIPDVATIGAAGDLFVECGEFRMGARQKLTVLGTLQIAAGDGIVTLGDVNALNDLIVDAGEIRVRSRDGGEVRTLDGSVTDLGVDIIAGGTIGFSVVPVVLGNGQVLFASLDANADANGTLTGFELIALSAPVDLASLLSGGVYFDLAASGFAPPPGPPVGPTSTASPATVLAVDDPDANDDDGDSDRAILRENERLALARALGPGVAVRRPLAAELARRNAGAIAFDEGRDPTVGTLDAPVQVPAARLSRAATVRFLDASARLESLVDSDASRETARALLDSMRRDDAADAGDGSAIASAMSEMLRWGDAIGLTEAERAAAGRDGVPFPMSRLLDLVERR
jgi:filamentous hemagglutinin family protein